MTGSNKTVWRAILGLLALLTPTLGASLTLGPPQKVECPIDGARLEVRPVKSQLHVPLWSGGPVGETLYTCPHCGHVGGANDYLAEGRWTPANRQAVAKWLVTGVPLYGDLFERAAEQARARGAGRDELLHRYGLAARFGAPEAGQRAWRAIAALVAGLDGPELLGIQLLAARKLGDAHGEALAEQRLRLTPGGEAALRRLR